jgi:beta subunit of N-acylethanolamine-hydrolyzing acid amidase
MAQQQDSKSTKPSEHVIQNPAADSKYRAVPRYVVDLDLPAEERWRHVLDDFVPQGRLEPAKQLVRDMIGSRVLLGIVRGLLGGLTHLGLVYYHDELKAVCVY